MFCFICWIYWLYIGNITKLYKQMKHFEGFKSSHLTNQAEPEHRHQSVLQNEKFRYMAVRARAKPVSQNTNS